MALNFYDFASFTFFVVVIFAVSWWVSGKKESTDDYFLAGRALPWWLIGFSLIASNISSEHFIGMSGKGFSEVGLAIASYEWMAAVTLVIVSFLLLPRFLRAGIYTIPEFLQYRYSVKVRTIMAGLMLLVYVFVTLATVLYSGALAISALFKIDIVIGIWVIGIISATYSFYGGLKAAVYSDLIISITLLIGGLIVSLYGLQAIGGWEGILETAGDRLHTILPSDHPEMPWTAVFIGGLWIPNLFYWGLNQFITQRTLAARSIEDGQKGILLAATIKLFIPFIVVFPGIMAYGLFKNEITDMNQAYPYFVEKVLPAGFRGILFAALFGAVTSTFVSLLNSASTIFTMDIYKQWINRDANQKELVRLGRIVTVILVLIGCLYSPVVGKFQSIFDYIQKFWGMITPGIVTAFAWGIAWKRVPSSAAIVALLLNIPIYGFFLWYDEGLPEGEKIAFLHYMGYTFVLLSLFVLIHTLLFPNRRNIQYPIRQEISLKTSPLIYMWSAAILLAVGFIYWYFQ